MIGNTLLVVSNDGKKGHQFIHIVDYPSGMECGKLLQTIPINSKSCGTPHLLGIDRDSEDVYVACLAGGGVKRLTKNSFTNVGEKDAQHAEASTTEGYPQCVKNGDPCRQVSEKCCHGHCNDIICVPRAEV